jgi:hypothetical protein
VPKKPERPSPASPPASDPPPSAAASSPESGKVSQTSESEGFVADAGPAFDPEQAEAINGAVPRSAPPSLAPAPPPIEWEEDTIEALLRLKGRALHAAIGVGENDWQYTALDLAAIAPPLARICNRYEPIARLAKHSDPLVLAFAFGGYGVRSLEERRAVLAQYQEEDEGVPEGAPPRPESAVPQAPPPQPPAAPQPPRQAGNLAAGPAPPMQPTAPPPPPPPRPGEAPVDPTAVEWQVGE